MLEQIYLIRLFRISNIFEVKGIDNLDEIKVPNAIANNKTALVKYIFEERLREFAGLGYRWFDMRRIVGDSIFSVQKFSHKLYTEEGKIKTTYDVDINNMYINLPLKILAQTPSLK